MQCCKCQYGCDGIDHGPEGCFWVCGRCGHEEPVQPGEEAAFQLAQRMYWSLQCQAYYDDLECLDEDDNE